MRKRRNYKDPSESIKWGETKTDESYYVPTYEMIKNQIITGQVAPSEDYYDFKDGKDDGKNLNIIRREGVDRAEISQEILRLQSQVKKEIDEGKNGTPEELKEAKEIEKNAKAIVNALKELANANNEQDKTTEATE